MDLPDFADEKYNAVARFFHWAIAFLMVFMLGLGLTMGGVNYGIPRHNLYDLHKSVGLLILLLTIGRILWRFASIPPEALDTHAAWERVLAKAAHLFLYFALLAMPLTGWLMSDAAGRSPTFFGLPVPHLLQPNDELRNWFGFAHHWIAYGVIGVIGLHVAGALKHHIIDKDATLRRMAGDRLQWFKVVATLLLVDLLLSAGAFLYLKDATPPTTPVVEQVASSTLDMSNLPEHGWVIDPGVSRLEFQSSAMGQAFAGMFPTYSGTIIFDPNNVAMARADIQIDMSEAHTGDAERDGMLQQSDWFSVSLFPKSRFVTRTIQHTADNNYLAIGDLTIRDTTMPVSIPFTLDITEQDKQRVAHMQGRLTLNRLDFGVGQGEWQATEAVPANVVLVIDLKVAQPR